MATENNISYVYEGTADDLIEGPAEDLITAMRGVRFNKNDYYDILHSANFIYKAEILKNTKIYFLNNKPIQIAYGLRILYSFIGLFLIIKMFKIIHNREIK